MFCLLSNIEQSWNFPCTYKKYNLKKKKRFIKEPGEYSSILVSTAQRNQWSSSAELQSPGPPGFHPSRGKGVCAPPAERKCLPGGVDRTHARGSANRAPPALQTACLLRWRMHLENCTPLLGVRSLLPCKCCLSFPGGALPCGLLPLRTPTQKYATSCFRPRGRTRGNAVTSHGAVRRRGRPGRALVTGAGCSQ